MCHNNASTLARAIRSVQACSSVVRIVVSDDASSDETGALVQEFSNDHRLSYRKHVVNLGQSAHWDHCIKSAKSDLFAVLHADDEYIPSSVDRVVNCFAAQPELQCVFAPFRKFHRDTDTVWSSWPPERKCFKKYELFEYLLRENRVLPSATFIKTEFLRRCPSPNPNLNMLTDRAFFLSMSLMQPRAKMVSFFTTNYLVHDMSVTAQSYEDGSILKDFDCMIDNLAELIEETLPAAKRYEFNIKTLKALKVQKSQTVMNVAILAKRRGQNDFARRVILGHLLENRNYIHSKYLATVARCIL